MDGTLIPTIIRILKLNALSTNSSTLEVGGQRLQLWLVCFLTNAITVNITQKCWRFFVWPAHGSLAHKTVYY